jgi:hypothetical protein
MKITALVIAIAILCSAACVFAEWIDPMNLEKGVKYVLGKGVRINPGIDPPATEPEYRKIKKAPRGGTIKVIRHVIRAGHKIYYVNAKDRDSKLICNGWIDARMLSTQALEEVKKKKEKVTGRTIERLMSNIWGGDK